METPSRRAMLTAAAVTVSLPMLEAALGTLRKLRAADPAVPAAPGAAAPASEAAAPNVPEGWVTTTLKPAMVKNNQFTQVAGQKIVLVRKGKTIRALSNLCTHRNVPLVPMADKPTLTCKAHGSIFDLDGVATKKPATKPLVHFAI